MIIFFLIFKYVRLYPYITNSYQNYYSWFDLDIKNPRNVINFITIKLRASVGFAKLLRIRVLIYSVVKAASPPKIKVLKF
jgi:hypothetical protein